MHYCTVAVRYRPLAAAITLTRYTLVITAVTGPPGGRARACAPVGLCFDLMSSVNESGLAPMKVHDQDGLHSMPPKNTIAQQTYAQL